MVSLRRTNHSKATLPTKDETRKLIGIEEHFLTAEMRQAWDAVGLQAVDPSLALRSGTIENRLLDLATSRIALMDETDWMFRSFH